MFVNFGFYFVFENMSKYFMFKNSAYFPNKIIDYSSLCILSWASSNALPTGSQVHDVFKHNRNKLF